MTFSLLHSTVATAADDPTKEINKTQWNGEHAATMATGYLLGRSSASTGAVEEIAIGSNLTLSGGTLSATGGGGGGSSSLTYTSEAGANRTMAVNTVYVVDMSGASADVTYTLPGAFVPGDICGVVIATAHATYKLIITAGTGDTLNGVNGGTAWSSLKMRDEAVQIVGTVTNAKWSVDKDGRIPTQLIMQLTSQADGEAATTWVLATACSTAGAWTAAFDNANTATVGSDMFTAFRAGRYRAHLNAASKDSVADAGTYRACLSLNSASPVVAIIAAMTNAAAGVATGSTTGLLNLAAGDTLQYMFRSSAGGVGAGAYTTSSSAFGTWWSIAEELAG